MAVEWLGLGPVQDETSGLEQRRLAPKPAFNFEWKTIRAFPKSYEAYFDDHFFFRNALIRLYGKYQALFPLRESPSPSVVIGKDGWLFYADENVIDDYRQENLFGPQELETIKRHLEQRKRWLEEQGIRFVVTVAPNTHSIYPEHLPDPVRGIIVPGRTRLDQVIQYLKEHSDIEIVDNREALLQAKTVRRTYMKTDTHWNAFGAWVGYRELMNRLSADFPALQPRRLDEFAISSVQVNGGDLARMMGMGESLYEEDIVLTPKFETYARNAAERKDPGGEPGKETVIKETGNGELPRAVMFRDSFANALIPYLSEHFSRIVYIWDHRFHPEIVREEKPDVVIHEIVERYLWVLLWENPPEVQ